MLETHDLKKYLKIRYTPIFIQVANWCIIADFQILNCCYSFRIQPMWLKFGVALFTRFDLLS